MYYIFMKISNQYSIHFTFLIYLVLYNMKGFNFYFHICRIQLLQKYQYQYKYIYSSEYYKLTYHSYTKSHQFLSDNATLTTPIIKFAIFGTTDNNITIVRMHDHPSNSVICSLKLAYKITCLGTVCPYKIFP
jgi:hypothetical protein